MSNVGVLGATSERKTSDLPICPVVNRKVGILPGIDVLALDTHLVALEDFLSLLRSSVYQI